MGLLADVSARSTAAAKPDSTPTTPSPQPPHRKIGSISSTDRLVGDGTDDRALRDRR